MSTDNIRQPAQNWLADVMAAMADRIDDGRDPRLVVAVNDVIAFEISLIRAPGVVTGRPNCHVDVETYS